MTLRGSGFTGVVYSYRIILYPCMYTGAPYRVDLYDKYPPRGTVRRLPRGTYGRRMLMSHHFYVTSEIESTLASTGSVYQVYCK